MSVIDQAIEIAAACGDSLGDLIAEAMPDGIAYLGSDAVVIAFPDGEDGLFIVLAVGPGTLHKLALLAPPRLKRIGWARRIRGKPERYYSFPRFLHLLHYFHERQALVLPQPGKKSEPLPGRAAHQGANREGQEEA